MWKTLIVEDDKPLASTLARALKKCDCECVVVHDIASGREASSATAFDLALVDIGLPDGNGLDLVQPLRHASGRPAVVVITARDDHEATAEAFQPGAVDCLIKPLDFDELATLVGRLFQMRDAVSSRRIEAAAGPLWPGQLLVAKSVEMRQVLRDIARCARSSATVLILGEPGVGKQVVARAIHDASPVEGHFVPLRCKGLSVAEFGSEAAGAGVLFLDEVGDLPINTQTALLQFLRERRFSAELDGRSADARVIAATAKQLDAEASAGRFREDLLRRLHVVRIRVPPLRRRAADFSSLLDRVLAAAARKQRLRSVLLDRDAERMLLLHGWPGNVRELGQTMQQLLAAGHERITVEALRAMLTEAPMSVPPVEEPRVDDEVSSTR